LRRTVFLVAARNDIVAIKKYIAGESFSIRTADRFVDALRQRCQKLAVLPGLHGRPRPELGADLRSVVHGAYVIFFRYVGDRIAIVRIIEGHRDLPAVVPRSD
jgi:toxin ParE1/3/4